MHFYEGLRMISVDRQTINLITQDEISKIPPDKLIHIFTETIFETSEEYLKCIKSFAEVHTDYLLRNFTDFSPIIKKNLDITQIFYSHLYNHPITLSTVIEFLNCEQLNNDQITKIVLAILELSPNLLIENSLKKICRKMGWARDLSSFFYPRKQKNFLELLADNSLDDQFKNIIFENKYYFLKREINDFFKTDYSDFILVLLEHIEKFHSSSVLSIVSIFGKEEIQRVIISRIFFEFHPSTLIREFPKLKIKNGKFQKYIFEVIFKKKPFFLLQNLLNFSFLFEEENLNYRFFLTMEYAEKFPHNILLSLPSFELSSEQNFLVLKKLTPINSAEIFNLIKKINLDNEQLLSILCEIAEKNSKNLIGIRNNFFIGPEAWLKMIKASLKSSNSYFLLDSSTIDDIINLVNNNPEYCLLIDFNGILSNVNSISFIDLDHIEKILHLASKKHPTLPEIIVYEILNSTYNKNTRVLCSIIMIKQGFIKNPETKREIAWETAKFDLNLLLKWKNIFDIEDPKEMYILIKKLAIKKTATFFICFDQLASYIDENQKNFLLSKGAEIDGVSAANWIIKNQNFYDHSFLLEIANKAINQSEKAFDILLNTKNLDLKDIINSKIKDFIFNLSIKNDSYFLQLLSISSIKLLKTFIKNPDVLQALSDCSYNIHWHCKIIARIAELYQCKGNKEKALKWRFKMTSLSILTKDNPLVDFEDRMSQPKILRSTTNEINFGVAWSHMGSSELKGGFFKVKDIIFNGEKCRCMYFKVTYLAAESIRKALSILENPYYCNMAKSLWQTEITIDTSSEFFYYPCENGEYNTKSPISFPAGKVITVVLKDLGKIQIGSDKQHGSMINDIHIFLNENSNIVHFQKVLSLMGITHFLIPSTEGEILRLKINKLLHFYYPQIATKYDRENFYYELTTSDLLNRIADLKDKPNLPQKILGKLKDIQFYPSLAGEKVMYMNNLALEAERHGARGLYAGMNSNEDFKSIIQRLASIKKTGLLSTQARFEAGMLIEGTSPKDDFLCNSADSLFFRVVTQKAIQDQEQLSTTDNLGGCMQIILRTKVFNFLGISATTDGFGCRNRDTSFNGLKNFHENRPKFLNFIKRLQSTWLPYNEFMLKNYLDPKYIVGVSYQDQRKILAKNLELINPNFFNPSFSIEEKADYISNHREEVITTLQSKNLLDNRNLYLNFDLDDHWLVNPREEITQAFEKEGCKTEDFFIIETNTMSETLFEGCHDSKKRIEKLEKQSRELAGKFQVETIKKKMGIRPHFLINEIRFFLSKLSWFELNDFLSVEILDKVAKLQQLCSKYLNNVAYSGRDSINRQLLTSNWNAPLRDPNVILAVYVLEALKNKPDNLENHYKDLYRLIDFNTNIGKSQTITDSIYFGFKSHHPILLEKMPNNIDDISNQKEIFLEEYLRRNQIEETFLPVWEAIKCVYQKIMQSNLMPEYLEESQLDIPYCPTKWNEAYIILFDKILYIIDLIDENQLLSLAAKEFTPHKLKKQSLAAFHDLLGLEGFKCENLTISQICKVIKSSIYLLDPQISHLFYDNLHILAALKSNTLVETLEGHITYRQIFIFLIFGFKDGVSQDEHIAAEQFYIRLATIYDKLVFQYNL